MDSGMPPEASLAAVSTVRERKHSKYETIVRVILSVLVFIVPLAYTSFTSVPHEYTKGMLVIAAACLTLIIWLLGVVVSGSLTLRATPLHKAIAAFMLATIVATVFSLQGEGLLGSAMRVSSSLFFVMGLGIVYWLIVNVFDDRGSLVRNVLSVSIFAVLVIGLCQLMGWHVLPTALGKITAFLTVSTVNTLGILAAVFLPIFTKQGMRGHVGIRIFGTLGVVAALLVLAALNWWVLWVVAIVGMLALVAFDSLNTTQLSQDYEGVAHRFSLSRLVVPITVIVLASVLLLVNISLPRIRQHLPLELVPTQQLSWDVVAHVLKDRPVVGYGPGMFVTAFDAFAAGRLTDPQVSSLRFFNASSEAAMVTAETGGIGILALLIGAWAFIEVVRRFVIIVGKGQRSSESQAFTQYSIGTMSAVVALVAAFFLYPFNATLAFVGIVLLALASLVVSGDTSTTSDIEDRPLHALSASLGLIVSLVLVLVALYMVTVHYMADIRYARAMKITDDSSKALEGVASAITLDSSNTQYFRDASQLALVVLRDELKKPGATATQEASQKIQNLIATAVQLGQRATTIAPLDTRNWVNLSLVYQSLAGVVGDVETLAADALSHASALRPGDAAFDNRTGELWLARADRNRALARSNQSEATRADTDMSLGKAEEAFKHAIEKVPAYGLAIYNLGAVYDRQGKVAEAITQLERIVPYNANQPTLMFELGLLYLRVNNRQGAEAALRRAVLLAPQFSNARWYLGLILEEKRDIAGALAQFQEIQKGNHNNQALNDKLTSLGANPPVTTSGEPIEAKPIQ
jgi:tetratricopeptide (TPR) repeat protein